VTAWILLALLQPAAPSTFSVTPSRCEFGVVRAGDPVACTFTLRNSGSETGRITGASLTQPLTMRRAPAAIPPDQAVTLQVELPTSGLTGPYEGALTLNLEGARPETLILSVTGTIRQPIELQPLSAFYLAGHDGEPASQAIEIVSHDPAPLSLSLVTTPPEGVSVSLETIEPGRRFRLTLSLAPVGPVGQRDDEIVIATNHPSRPTLKVPAHTWRRARVYTFPESVDVGAIPLAQLVADPARYAQTLMVYQRRGTNFEVRCSIDTPAIAVTATRGAQGDRFQLTLTHVPAALVPGPLRATLVLETNDRDFTRIEVPVRGAILQSP
jgi:hypothetical protein